MLVLLFVFWLSTNGFSDSAVVGFRFGRIDCYASVFSGLEFALKPHQNQNPKPSTLQAG